MTWPPGANDDLATSDNDGAGPDAPTAIGNTLNTTLANNGGPTNTHALVAGSPAVDLAPSTACTAAPVSGVDQRGDPRNVDGNGAASANECDAGAFEYDPPPPPTGDIVIVKEADPADNTPFDFTEDIPGPGNGFTQDARFVDGVSGKVDGMDLVWWDGSGFSLWFDGQDVGLTVLTKEKIDALHVLDGSQAPPALAAAAGGSCLDYLLISTAGDGQVPNYSGGNIKFDGTDVLGFCLTQSGATTQGKWIRVLNGKAEGMPGQALINLSASDDGQTLYLTTRATFNVDSATGGHSMVYRYDFATGEFSGPFFSAPANGLDGRVDGLQVDGELP